MSFQGFGQASDRRGDVAPSAGDVESQLVVTLKSRNMIFRILTFIVACACCVVQMCCTSPSPVFHEEYKQAAMDYMVSGASYWICVAVIVAFKSDAEGMNQRECSMMTTVAIIGTLKVVLSIWCSTSQKKKEFVDTSFIPTVVDAGYHLREYLRGPQNGDREQPQGVLPQVQPQPHEEKLTNKDLKDQLTKTVKDELHVKLENFTSVVNSAFLKAEEGLGERLGNLEAIALETRTKTLTACSVTTALEQTLARTVSETAATVTTDVISAVKGMGLKQSFPTFEGIVSETNKETITAAITTMEKELMSLCQQLVHADDRNRELQDKLLEMQLAEEERMNLIKGWNLDI